MRRSRGLRTSVAAVAAVALAVGAETTAAQAVDVVVAHAGEYLAAFQRDVAGVVLEEKYLQQAVARVTVAREMRSDLAVMADPTQGWIEFRDVFEVDGRPVRDRENRVVDLFANPRPDSLDQAKRIVAEGARFNLNAEGVHFDRTINLPMAALLFLRTGNQARSRFQRSGTDSIDGHRVTIVRFEEQRRPRMIGSPDEAAAHGEFWIEPDTGRVLRTRLQLETRRGTTDVAAAVTVDYREHADLGLWLPSQMEEDYEFTGATRDRLAIISGRALYSNVRKFRVAVDEQVLPDNEPAAGAEAPAASAAP